MRIAPRRAWLLLGVLLGAFGCASGDEDALVIATTWPSPMRARWEADFRRWSEARGASSRIVWLPFAPGDDLAQLGRRRRPPDLLLGGPASLYSRLARDGLLMTSGSDGRPLWCVARRSSIGLAVNARADRHAVRPPLRTFDDPRHDPIALAWAQGVLASGTWGEGYARLVRDAGHPRRIRRQAGSALAAVERGAADATPALMPSSPPWDGSAVIVPQAEPIEWIEGAGLLRGAPHPERAREFFGFLAARSEAGPPPASDFEAEGLLADILGATLVDAQDELQTAWATLSRPVRMGTAPRTKHGAALARAEHWLTEGPPWPPASIERLRASNPRNPLLETLAAELAPDAGCRAWLLQSWLGPPRRIDGPVLDELAAVEGGRLMREPRFRAWLRAEWTAWARQRYRRVTRQAREDSP